MAEKWIKPKKWKLCPKCKTSTQLNVMNGKRYCPKCKKDV